VSDISGTFKYCVVFVGKALLCSHGYGFEICLPTFLDIYAVLKYYFADVYDLKVPAVLDMSLGSKWVQFLDMSMLLRYIVMS
jgi:hypothetical protein